MKGTLLQHLEGGVFLHAAAILGNQGVILLLGHSGSGKTTLSRMLSSRFELLRDDRVFLYPHEPNMWFVEIGTEIIRGIYDCNNKNNLAHIAGRQQHPLHCIIRIFGAQNSEIVSLPPIKTTEYLVDAIFEIDHQRKSRNVALERSWFKAAAQIARQYPGWRLSFPLNKNDVLRQLEKINVFVGTRSYQF